jgi:hypothetical protein
MNVTRRCSHPLYGDAYELQTFECRTYVELNEVATEAVCRTPVKALKFKSTKQSNQSNNLVPSAGLR